MIKQRLIKILFATSIIFSIFSCSQRGEDGPAAPSFDENANHPLSVFQYPVLHSKIGTPLQSIKQELEKEKIALTYNEDEEYYYYFASNPVAPMKRYKVELYEGNWYDLDQRPKTKGITAIIRVEISPVKEDGTPATSDDYKSFFDYFNKKCLDKEPTKKAYEYFLHNRKLGNGYGEKLTTYEEFIKEISNPNKKVHGRITYQNNADVPFLQSSKAKNTPVQILDYDFEKKTYRITLKFNSPDDLIKYIDY